MQVQYCTLFSALQNVNRIIKVFQTHLWNSQTISCKEKRKLQKVLQYSWNFKTGLTKAKEDRTLSMSLELVPPPTPSCQSNSLHSHDLSPGLPILYVADINLYIC
jgi:hypothetical protein